VNAAPDSTPIEARLSAFDVSMVVFGLVVGIGIFRTPAIVARTAGDTSVFYAAWITAGLISLIGAGLAVANAIILQMPRSYYAMAEDGVLPRAFLRINPRTQIQDAGLAFFAATMLVPAFMLGSFEKLLDYIIFTDTLTIAAVASTLFVLRHRRTGEGGYTMRGYPLLPALYIAGLLAVAARAFSVDPGIGLAGIAILLTGWPLFRLGRRAFAVRPPMRPPTDRGR
jgi:amino acid transporter